METFVVRIWTPGETGLAPEHGLHGTVEQVAAARSAHFSDAEELIRLLRAGVLDAGDSRPVPALGTGEHLWP